jgi:hypothetical protein
MDRTFDRYWLHIAPLGWELRRLRLVVRTAQIGSLFCPRESTSRCESVCVVESWRPRRVTLRSRYSIARGDFGHPTAFLPTKRKYE